MRCAICNRLAPEVSYPLVSHGGVDNRVRDRTMAHESLKRPGIDSSTGQGVLKVISPSPTADVGLLASDSVPLRFECETALAGGGGRHSNAKPEGRQ